ncbi:MAG: transglycosylase domain-containing protein [bacterium]|nr:transglycosylase domain-containing protein [bacterium]
MKLSLNKKKWLSLVLAALFLTFLASFYLQHQLVSLYRQQASSLVEDREGRVIAIRPNRQGYFNRPVVNLPARMADLLVKKEDRFFYYHNGVNPISIIKASFGYLGLGQRKASSTISQQLAKILLGNELRRTGQNKLKETLYALSLEIFQPKREILKMYANSIYFGYQAQGIFEASRLYFGTDPEMLTEGQVLQLLATISEPAENNPASENNEKISLAMAKKFIFSEEGLSFSQAGQVREQMKKVSHADDLFFELKSFLTEPKTICQTTLDRDLTRKIREIVQRNIESLKIENARNAAVVVLKLPENEILSLIGSPDPNSFESGYQINMLMELRPIGSTIKPFIYLKAFEKGLRPYTLVEDREYKYITALGFPLYPKNFDYQYRGRVKLNYALSNSLNVPAVKVLEYVGLEDFYQFWGKEMGFKPKQPWNSYQLGIALGGLEMSLWDLARYFTIFPNQGWLKDVKVFQSGDCFQPKPETTKEIAQPGFIQLVNKILNDRQTGVEQFGMKSELNLFQENYALKTGTSRDFRDSWIIGYTPDFLVGVWVGNADNSPTDKISGQQGAGLIFSNIMELLLNSRYNSSSLKAPQSLNGKKTPFDFSLVKDFPSLEGTRDFQSLDSARDFQSDQGLDWGLQGDDYKKTQNLLLAQDTALILLPHDGDSFLLEPNTKIILRARQAVDWFVNNEFIGHGQEQIFIPPTPGNYQVKAQSPTSQAESPEYPRGAGSPERSRGEEVSISVLGE